MPSIYGDWNWQTNNFFYIYINNSGPISNVNKYYNKFNNRLVVESGMVDTDSSKIYFVPLNTFISKIFNVLYDPSSNSYFFYDENNNKYTKQ
jgi:hypothetical protein